MHTLIWDVHMLILQVQPLLKWVKVQNFQNPEFWKIISQNLQYAYKYQQFQV